MVLSKLRARKDVSYLCSTYVRDVSIFRDNKMSISVVYAGQFVELITSYHLVIAENLIKIYSGEYAGESLNMGLLMLTVILKNMS